jgi:serine/threonine-protein kinase
VIGTMFGPYRVDSLIGRGGMGEVYRAVDTGQDGRRVALKILPSALSGDPQFVARFRREAEIAARLSDPHVVPIHRYGETDGRLFLDMLLIDGRELADVLAQDGPLAPARALSILEQVAGAIDAAHADGLVHRDVKPSNILLTQPGAGRAEFAYLLDFGIARSAEPGSRTALTRTGAVIGTLSYMAPERFLAQPTGPAADVYSLACVLHELLTGARPYPGTGYAAQVAGHLHQPPPRPSSMRAGLPEALDAVVARGMAKDPAHRYPTASELVAAAHEALAGVDVPPAGPRGAATVVDEPAPPTWVPPVAAAPPWQQATPPPPPPRGRGRRWLPAAGVAALAAAVLATVLVVVAQPPAEPGTPDPHVEAAAPADALPSGGPIIERTIVGAAPDVWKPVIAELDGTPVLVRVDTDVTAVYDLATGERVGVPLQGLFGAMSATVTRLDGRSVLITGSSDRVIRMYDLAAGEPLPTTMTGHTGVISHLAVVEVDGRKVLISGSDDSTIRRWDLATATQIGEPLTGHAGRLTAMSVVGDDRPVVLARGYDDDAISSFDVATGAPAGPPVPAVQDNITTVALPGGLAVMSTPDYGQMLFVDLRTGARFDHGITDRMYSSTTAAAVVGGIPVLAVSSYSDNTVQLRDLRTGQQVTAPLAGHEAPVRHLDSLTVDGRTFLVSSSSDRSIRIWDLNTRMGR